MIGMLVAAALVFALGLLTLWWARACLRGTLPRNRIFGYRTRLTLSSTTAWVATHRAAGPFVVVAGLGASIAALVGAVLALTGHDAASPAFFGGGLVWLLAWVLVGIVPAHRAAKRLR